VGQRLKDPKKDILGPALAILTHNSTNKKPIWLKKIYALNHFLENARETLEMSSKIYWKDSARCARQLRPDS